MQNASSFLAMLLLGMLAFAAPKSFAARIIWQSTPGQTDTTSSGDRFDQSVNFELGTFKPGFTPTPANVEQWAANWETVGRTKYREENRFFSNTVTFTNNQAPYYEGRQAYIWGFTTNTSPPEWILVTNPAWTWPASSFSFPVTWSVAKATKVVIGSLNVSGTPAFMRTAPVPQGTPAGAFTVIQWFERHFSASELSDETIGEFISDPDGDGMDNRIEMGLGGDPKVAEKRPFGYAHDVVTVDGLRYLRMTVTKQAILDVYYHVEVSSDAQTWQTGLLHTETLIDDVTTLSVRDTVPLTVGNQRFIRLTIEVLED